MDGVAPDRVGFAERGGDSGDEVEGDEIAFARSRAAHERAGGVAEPDAVAVGNREHAVGIGAEPVPLDGVSGSVDGDRVAAVSGDEVAGARPGPADEDSAGARDADPVGRVAHRVRAGGVGSDPIPLEDRAGGGCRDVDGVSLVPRDHVALAGSGAAHDRSRGAQVDAEAVAGGHVVDAEADDVALNDVAGRRRVDVDADRLPRDDVAGDAMRSGRHGDAGVVVRAQSEADRVETDVAAFHHAGRRAREADPVAAESADRERAHGASSLGVVDRRRHRAGLVADELDERRSRESRLGRPVDRDGVGERRKGARRLDRRDAAPDGERDLVGAGGGVRVEDRVPERARPRVGGRRHGEDRCERGGRPEPRQEGRHHALGIHVSAQSAIGAGESQSQTAKRHVICTFLVRIGTRAFTPVLRKEIS
jgi:hypothetical protein